MLPTLASVWHQGELHTEASGFHVMAPGVAELEFINTSVIKEAQLSFSPSDPCLITLNDFVEAVKQTKAGNTCYQFFLFLK